MSERLKPVEVRRRDFLSLVGWWTAGVALFGSIVGMVRLAKPRVFPEAARRFSVGDPADFPSGTEQVIKERNVLVLGTGEGVAATSLVCTHLGCIVTKETEGFICPCHGSKFNPEGGVISGPAPRGLPWLEVSRRTDGKLLVDAKKEVKPGTFYPV